MAQAAQGVATAPAPAVAAPAAPVRPPRDVPTALLVAAVLLALLPIAISAVRALDGDWFPIGDNSVVYARTKDVFTADTPLLYMWSSGSTWAEQDFNNPGPMLYWILAVPTAALGPSGMVLATAVLNGAAVVGLAYVARRRGGPLVGVAAVAVAATLGWTMGSSVLTDPWPPNSLLLPTLLYLVLVWSVADGDVVALPFVAGVGSLLLQTNLSYALLAPALGLFAVAGLAVHLGRERRRDPRAWPALRRRAQRAGWATAGVLVVVWTPPVIEQLTSDGDGNLTRIARGMGELPLSLGAEGALRLVAGVVAVPWWWFRGSFWELYADPPSTALSAMAAAAVAAVVAGVAWLAVRRRDRLAVAGIATAACALALAFVTTARSPVDRFGLLSPYRTRYLWAVAAFVALVVLVAAARPLLRDGRSQLVGMGALVAVTAIVTLANLPAYRAGHGPLEPPGATEVVHDLRRQLADVGARQTVLFDWRDDSASYQYWADGVLAELARRDVPFVVRAPFLVRTLGEHRRTSGDDADLLMRMGTGENARHVPPGARRVALSEGLEPAEVAELGALRAGVVQAFDDGDIRLTANGARVLAGLGGGGGAAGGGAGHGRELVEGRHVSPLLDQGFLDLDGTWRRRIERYVELEKRSDERTVAVFVQPVRRED